MVRITVAALTSALLLAATSPLASALPYAANSTDFVARAVLEARYDPMLQSADLDRRANQNLQPPNGYRLSWTSDGTRSSYGTSTGQYLTRNTINGDSVGQDQVNTCGAICEKTVKCGFFELVQMNGGNEGNMVCVLYTTKQGKADATWNKRPGTTGGNVVASYPFTRNAGFVTGANLPAAPNGATILQFKGCSNTDYTVPLFVSRNYPFAGSSNVDTVWIVQHGSGRNFNDYFSSVYNVVGDQGVVMAPNFYATSDSGKWFQPNFNLAWNNNAWFDGADAIAPAGVPACSSMDVYDNLLNFVYDRSKFPNLKRVFLVGHSAGASMLGKYNMLSKRQDIRYILANSPSNAYFTNARPNPDQSCGGFTNWGYGWDGALPRYVASRNPGGAGGFVNYITKDVTLMTGTIDTFSRDSTGDQSCQVKTQGGENRRDRGYAWWAYLNLLGGTNTDVSQFYGYNTLKGQVSSLRPWKFGARYCVVPNTGHDNYAMFASDCGRAALNGASSIPYGPGPIRP